MSEAVYLLPGLRSPFTRMDGRLGRLRALEISAPVIQQTVVGANGPGPERADAVDLVVWGSVVPTLSVANWGREAWFEAGLDPSVPGLTVVEQCATSLAAATLTAGQIRAGKLDLALCGGVEAMSQVQLGLSRGLSRKLRGAGAAKTAGARLSTLASIRPKDLRIHAPGVKERVTGKSMGEHCEEMAKEWRIGREEQDRLALASHQRAVGERGGFFRPLLVKPGTFATDRDTIPRPDTSLDKLASLRPVFDRERGTLTAGNSSPLTDGAACCWTASQTGVERLPDSLPRARLVDWEQAAIDLRREGLLMAPAIAIPRLLARHNLGYEEIDLWEIHEAFAAQVLCTIEALQDRAWVRERAGVDRDFGRFPDARMNPNGGSVAIGHPFAATGARILSQAVRELAGKPTGSRAVVSVCAAGGLGVVALLQAD